MTTRVVGTLGLALLLAGCIEDQALSPPPTASAGAMFDRYVAIGNSITAGFQSAGIDSVTQSQSYAATLAEQMGTRFVVPWLNLPGCPAPYTNVFTQTRAGGTGDMDCALRAASGLGQERLHLVAVPGAAVIDVLTNLDSASGPNPLTTILLGGRTQLEVARAANPTFVSVWIGNNDVLGAVLSETNPGDSAEVTPLATFTERYAGMIDTLERFGTIQGGVLIGVTQAVFAPYLSQGRAWEGFEMQFDATTGGLNALDVENCVAFQELAPGDTLWVSVPFPVGGAALSAAQAKLDSVQNGTLPPGQLQPAVIDCTSPAAVSLAELARLVNAVTQYNTFIQQAAMDLEWAYLDPNVLLEQLLADPNAIRPLPTFTDQANPDPFGTALSDDGIHPSASGHAMVAAALIAAINAQYGSSIPQP